MDSTPYFIKRACDPDEHEFRTKDDGTIYCDLCKFSEDSLRNVLGQQIDDLTP